MGWTGSDTVRLRDALELSRQQFADRLGVSLGVVKKWASRGETIVLDEFHAGLMDTALTRATPVQRSRYLAVRQQVVALAPGAVEVLAPQFDWGADPTVLAANLTRRDLLVDRRTVGQAIASMIVGVSLLEPLERWLMRDQALPAPLVAGAGTEEIGQLENVAQAFHEWDDAHGGGLRRMAVVGQLREVSDLLQDRQPATIERRLLRVQALLAETAATMSWDSRRPGDQETAQGYYLLAVRAAKQAGDPALCANAMAGIARQLLSLDHYGTVTERAQLQHDRATDALEIVRLAQDRLSDRVTPTVRALLATREAWAYAKLGRPEAFRRACEKAEDAYADAAPADDPYWVQYFDAAELTGTIGGRLLEIARNDTDFAGEAAETITSAIALRRPDRRRSSALDHLGVLEARLIEGEIEEACRLGHAAVDAAGQTASDRVRRKLTRIYDRTGQLASIRDVTTLRDRMRPLVGAAT
ncbi:hypothetical protein [Nocardia sp. NPDC046763]|uniref:hypothetical protein n=1 Tax=Nocardia sp. NPDC046763 TaxID=3155256 RepID=UPI0033EF44D5